MPWRGPEQPGEFPTLGHLIAEWIEDSCVIPDRHNAGERFELTAEQERWLLWYYRLHPSATVDEDKPSAPFVYNGGVLVRPQKWGKGPLTAAEICVQAEGPVLFAGWDADGEPVGMPWPSPWIQITAISEDQTDNVYKALRPMIELGPLADRIPDTGETRINLPGGGLIEPVTASARSRLGQRVTYVVQDETHSYTKRNGGHTLADNQRRNLAGTGGRWAATTNAYDPAEKSVAQEDIEHPLPDVLIDYPEPLPGSWKNKRERRKILVHAYKGAPWVDLDRIESDCQRLAAKGDPGQAERFFGNRVSAGADAAFDPIQWKKQARPSESIAAGRVVTLGFDGARHRDSTGIIATDVEAGFQVKVAVWERPKLLVDDEPWEVPEAEVNDAIANAFETWDVWRLYADPPYWDNTVDAWVAKYVDKKGAPRVVPWWTNRYRIMAFALQGYRNAMTTGALTHDGDETFAEHIGNARRKRLPAVVDDEGHQMWIVEKDRPDSPRRIDLSVAGCLSWEARGDAIAAGALAPKKKYRAAGF